MALAANGFEWIAPLVFIIVGLAAGGAAIVSTVRLLLLWGRSRFHFSLFHVMLCVTWLAIFCAGERFMMTSPWARRLDAGPVIHFLLAVVAFYVGVLPTLLWREHRRQRATAAVAMIASESAVELEPADDAIKLVEDVLSAIDVCPICKLPITTAGEPTGAWMTSTVGHSGNIRITACGGCGARLQGVRFAEGPSSDSTAEDPHALGVRWEARVLRKSSPDEVRMISREAE